MGAKPLGRMNRIKMIEGGGGGGREGKSNCGRTVRPGRGRQGKSDPNQRSLLEAGSFEMKGLGMSKYFY